MRNTLADAIRATVWYFIPKYRMNYILVREQIMANSVVEDEETRKLVFNPRTPIRVGKKGSDNK